MTLNEAINRARKLSVEDSRRSNEYSQLANWLEELRDRRRNDMAGLHHHCRYCSISSEGVAPGAPCWVKCAKTGGECSVVDIDTFIAIMNAEMNGDFSAEDAFFECRFFEHIPYAEDRI